MSLKIDDILDAIHAWATESNGGKVPSERVFIRERSAPTPLRPAIGFKIITGPQRTGSFDDLIPCEGQEGKFNLSGQRTMSIDIHVYGDVRERKAVAHQIALTLHSSLTAPNSLETLRRGGIAVYEINSIKNISDIEESEYEERYMFDIIIGVAENFEQKINEIKSVKDIAGNFYQTIGEKIND